MKIVVIGGTGRIGSLVVDKLTKQGHHIVPASPTTGVDTLTGTGLAEALDEAAVVVDASNARAFEANAMLDFFETSTRNLLGAETAAGVGHHVVLSVVGVGSEGISGNAHYRAKAAQENLIRRSSIPYSIVRATQFYEFIETIADAATAGDAVRVPPVLFQPVAADDVAAALADVAVSPPVNGIVEVAGPQAFRMDELIRRHLGAISDPREVITDPQAGYFGAAVSERVLLPGTGARLVGNGYEAWLHAS